ncbi:MAG: pyridoxamine 5'-phosphate oxidase family protein [Oceanipulchritudo sp.]
MNKLNNIWIKGATGALVAGLIIVGTRQFYPMNGVNLAGHVLTWAMAAIVGLKITLWEIREEDSWAHGVEGMEEAQGGAVSTEVATRMRGRETTVVGGPERMGLPAPVDRGLGFGVVRERSGVGASEGFRQPAEADKKECVAFAAENPICWLATVDEKNRERPHVRTVFLWRADESGFYFILFSSKRVSRQIKANPMVELCFQNHPTDLAKARQLRVSGRMELKNNRILQQKAREDRTILNKLAGDGEETQMEIFHLSSYEMKFWQMGAARQRAKSQPVWA